MENQTEKKIKRLRTNNSLELCSSYFDEFYKSKGIARHNIVRDTPQQNGVVERMNQTLLKRELNACSLMLDLPDDFGQKQLA